MTKSRIMNAVKYFAILVIFALEKETATHSSIHAWKIPWTEEPVGYILFVSLWGRKESDTTEWLLCVCVYLCLFILFMPFYTVRKEKRAAKDEMVGWHHQFSGHELGRTLGDGEGQEGLAESWAQFSNWTTTKSSLISQNVLKNKIWTLHLS